MTDLVAGAPGRQFEPRMTWLYLFLVLLLSTYLSWDYATSAPAEKLYYPVYAVEQSLGAELDYIDGYRKIPVWHETILNLFWYSEEEITEAGIKAWHEVLAVLDDDPGLGAGEKILNARYHLVVLLAEKNGWPDAEQQLAKWKLDNGQHYFDDLRKLYAAGAKGPVIISVPDGITPGRWTSNTVLLREAKLNGQADVVASLQRQKAELETSQVRRSSFYTFSWWGLVVSGLFIFILSSRRLLRQHTYARPSSHLSIADAFGVFIRAELIVTLYTLALQFITVDTMYILGIPVTDVIFGWYSLINGLIVLWLVHVFLFKNHVLDYVNDWGLSFDRLGGSRGLFIWMFGIYVFTTLGNHVIAYILTSLPLEYPWTEGLSETLMWGSYWDVFIEFVNTVIWAPVFEEILFRGVLYLGLRKKFSVMTSVIFSALIFSALHFYSVAGFIEVFWIGVVTALVFEYSRSLLPAIGIHMLSNFEWFVFIMLYYRV